MEKVNILCEGLKENSYYAVWVKVSENNVPHKAVLYTGFMTGSYRKIMTGTYEQSISEHNHITAQLISELVVLNDD